MAKLNVKEVTGAYWGHLKSNNDKYTIIHTKSEISPKFGIGYCTEQHYIGHQHIDVDVGDKIVFNYETASSGKLYITSITKIIQNGGK